MRRFVILLIMLLSSVSHAKWYGTHDIDDYLTFAVTTSKFSTGAGFDAGSVPTYSIYEDETAAEVVGPSSMAKLDDGGTVGFYTDRLQLTDANFDAGKFYTIYITATVDSVAGTTHHAFKMRAAPLALASGVNMTSISGDSTAADNLEAMFDGIGYADDNAPATQLQISTLAGGIAVSTIATGINIDEPNGGEQTLTYAATASHDGSYHEVASDDAGNDIDFYYTFNTGDGMNLPVSVHIHGYYEDNNAPANSTMVVQAYNFNIADWETIVTLTDSASDLDFILPLHIHDVDPDGGGAGDVRIRFNLTTPEVSQNIKIDHATVSYVTGGLTVAAIADGIWDEVIVSAHDTSNTAGALLDSPGDWATAVNVNVASEDNIDFGALKKTSLNAATPDLSAITGDKASYKATGFSVASDVTTAHSTTDGLINTAQADLDIITGANGVIIGSGSNINDSAWQELIELFFTFDATATYGTEGGSLVDQIADNAASGGGDASAASQTTMLARLAAIMSKAAADPSVGTFDPSTDSLEAQQENPQGPPIID